MLTSSGGTRSEAGLGLVGAAAGAAAAADSTVSTVPAPATARTGSSSLRRFGAKNRKSASPPAVAVAHPPRRSGKEPRGSGFAKPAAAPSGLDDGPAGPAWPWLAVAPSEAAPFPPGPVDGPGVGATATGPPDAVGPESGVALAAPVGVGAALGTTVVAGVGLGVGTGVGLGVGFGVGTGVGTGVGGGVEIAVTVTDGGSTAARAVVFCAPNSPLLAAKE
jgi:hypothetical protein